MGGLFFTTFILFPYFLPFWDHNEIPAENYSFKKIEYVDYQFAENSHISFDKVVMKTDRGEFYCWSQARAPLRR
jgi:hypothetical protein